jgi:hypothetical protein
MTIAYVVRCNFKDPEKEQAWNDWYSGPKLKQMLSKPHFLTVQRYRRVSGTGRNYLAFWTLASAQAFETPEYKNDWGFFEWRPFIIDWSRDLFEAERGDVHAPRVADNGFIRLVSFEGLSKAEAEAKRIEIDRIKPGTAWHRSIGLDHHTELLGTSVETTTALGHAIEGVHEALYQPISIFAVTENSAEAAIVR